jgi:nitrite reductase/ring-hydroxylating ferredoxin subunit/uncharacterized membrane protein
MTLRAMLDVIDRQVWLDRLGERLQRAVVRAFTAGGPRGRQVRDLLHGTWLGHPLHPALTDVPLGAWTAALVLDLLGGLTGRRAFGRGADAAVALGLAGALGAAAAGLTDWQHLAARPRRVGLLHGLLNVGATGLYGLSFLLRRRAARAAGGRVAVLGYATAVVAAYLGGELVYRERIGVSHVAGQTPPREFVPVLPTVELYEGRPRRVQAGGMAVLLVRRGDRFYALAETCSHLGGPLAEGRLEGDSVVCPWHGSRFALADGRVLEGPAVFPQPCLETRIRDGWIEVRAAEQ